jgi:hypothetical protein
MRSLLLCFMVRTKSSPEWQRITSVRVSEALWSKRPTRCRYYFTSHFSRCWAAGISNPARKEFFIPFSPESALALEKLHSSCFFKKGGPLWLVPAILAGRAAIMAIAGTLFFREAPSWQRIVSIAFAIIVCFCCANSFRSCQTRGLARNSAHRFNKRYHVRAIF